MTQRKHAIRFDVKLPQHAESLNTYYVIDCRCGWQSPLCKDKDRAHALYESHRRWKKAA